MSNDTGDFSELWAAAIEEHVAGLSDEQFVGLVARTRGGPMSQREVRASFAAKAAELTAVERDHNGARTPLPFGGQPPQPAAEPTPPQRMQPNRGQGTPDQSQAPPQPPTAGESIATKLQRYRQGMDT